MKKKIGFDVGACLGESIPKFEGFDEIYAFEPAPNIFNILAEKCKDDSRIKCFQIGISDENGLKSFNYHDHYGYSSFLEIYKEGEFAKKCHQEDPGFDDIIAVIEVQTKRLDTFMKENYIEHIDFLKIDTQGNDLNVIKSLGKMIDRVDIIELEVQIKPLYKNSSSKEEIVKFMQKNNFNLMLEEANSFLLEGYEQRLTFERKNDEKSIPVIGTAVVNSSYWVSRLLMSIDYPVDTFVIIDNNGRGELDEQLDTLKKIKHKYVKNIKICHLPANIGCSGAWNLIIKCFMMSPYWIIVNDDVAFDKGFLKEMVEAAESHSDVGVVHGNSGDFNVGSWDLFLIKDFVIQELGLFDENLYPAYCEDADYIMRMLNTSTKKITSLNSNYFHGDGNKGDYYETGSQTKKTDDSLSEKLEISNELNIKYLTKKWGPGWRVCEPEKLPFINEQHSIKETQYDLKFVRSKHMGF